MYDNISYESFRPFGIGAEEQTLREELETHRSGTEVSYEKYREDLEKILNPRMWDADLRFVLFPLAAVALGAVIIFFIRQIRMNLIREARDAVAETALEQVETERAALARADSAEAANDFRSALRFLYLSAIFTSKNAVCSLTIRVSRIVSTSTKHK